MLGRVWAWWQTRQGIGDPVVLSPERQWLFLRAARREAERMRLTRGVDF